MNVLKCQGIKRSIQSGLASHPETLQTIQTFINTSITEMLGKLTLKIPNKRKLREPIFFQHLFIEAEFVNLHL